MQVRQVTRMVVSITEDELKMMAYVLLKTGDPYKKLLNVKTLRDMVAEMQPVDIYGAPLVTRFPCDSCGDSWCNNAKVVARETFGLKECKDAVDSWFVEKEFVG